MRAGNGYRSWLPGETAHARAGECLSRAGTLLPSLSAETAMTELIAHLGRTLRADRCRMFEYDGDLLRFRNSHEWCALGVGSHLADLQDTPVAIIAWLHRDLLAGRTVMIDDVAALPAPARAFKRELLRQQVKSMLSVPIFQAGRLRACLALDAVQAPRAWRDDEAALLDLCARLIGAARYQKPGARPRRRRSRRESAVAVPGHGGGQDPGRAAAGHRRGPVDAQRDASLDRRRQRGARPASAAYLAHAIAAGIISQHSSHGHRQPVSCRRAGQARRRGFHWQLRPARRRRALARVPAASQDADRPTGMVKTYCASGADRASRTCSTNKDTTRGTCGV